MIEIQTITGSGEEKPMINDALFPLFVLAVPALLLIGLSILVFQLLLATVKIHEEED